jgi:hypothetical protein
MVGQLFYWFSLHYFAKAVITNDPASDAILITANAFTATSWHIAFIRQQIPKPFKHSH